MKPHFLSDKHEAPHEFAVGVCTLKTHVTPPNKAGAFGLDQVLYGGTSLPMDAL